jgi:hypothetical protein
MGVLCFKPRIAERAKLYHFRTEILSSWTMSVRDDRCNALRLANFPRFHSEIVSDQPLGPNALVRLLKS